MSKAKQKNNAKVMSADNNTTKPNSSIIGSYEGECADASITNENGMDITAEVFEVLFNSDEYKKAIDLGWYIGFLGHPEDPDCMDFEHSCIVMKEGHIEPDGKVYGKFDLVNTPVGQVVAALQDAGVTFGISIRGAGDLIGNSVDPETFVFRGFDLVTFPAFPDAIPEFTKIAASTDLEKRKKYQKACKTLKDNLQSITSSTALDVIKAQFAPQSDEYKLIEDREKELIGDNNDDDEDDVNKVTEIDDDLDAINASKLAGMVNLYMSANAQIQELKAVIASYREQIPQISLDSSRKLSSIERILGKQLDDVLASNDSLMRENTGLKQEIKASKKSNLIYKQKIETQDREISRQQRIISSLKAERSETVTASTSLKARTSDLDAQNKKLKSDLSQSHEIIANYQDAFASLYASILGANLNGVTVTASTTVDELKQQINSSSISNKYVSNTDYEYDDDNDIDEIADVNCCDVVDIATDDNPNGLICL